MSDATVDATAARIGEHAARHGLSYVIVVLHGGEPLLAGRSTLTKLVERVRAAVPARTRVDVNVQTNGTLLDERFLELFHDHDVTVGISVDGGQQAHDRHRRYANGRPSFDHVARALHLLARPEHRELYAGILCTVDLANDPVQTYEELIAFTPPRIDLLVPLGNWVHRPPARAADATTPYADWLIAVFDRWFSAPHRETGIRLFESLVQILIGGRSETEVVGLESAEAITVETDGALEISDALKSARHGIGATGLNVHHNRLDEAMDRPGVRAARRHIGTLPTDCRTCPVASTCGGGQYAHRYGRDGGFDHRSVYCPDLYRLIAHITGRLEEELLARRARATAA